MIECRFFLFEKLGCLPPKRGSWKNTILRTARRKTIFSRSAITRRWCGRRHTKSDAVSPNARTDQTNGREPLSALEDDLPSNIQNIFTITSVTIVRCKFLFLFFFISFEGQQKLITIDWSRSIEATTWNVWAVLTRRAPRAAAAKARANSASFAPIPVRTPICGSIVAN